MNETLVFLVSGVIAALISAMVCLLFRLWDSQRAKCNARTTSYCRHPRPGRFPWKMKTWVSFRIERTKIGIINYNKKTTAGKTPAVVLH